jgi:hypothetical protein
MISGRTVVVLSRFTNFSDFEPSGVIGAGDARALQELTAYFSDIGLDPPEVAYDGDLTGDQLCNDLILLGGPDANNITRLVLEKASGQLSVRPGATQISDGTTLLRPLVENGLVAEDCGALLRLRSPFTPSKRVVVAAGGFGYGTWAAIQLTRQDDFLRAARRLDDLECSFEVDVILSTPQYVRIRTLRALAPVAPADRADP